MARLVVQQAGQHDEVRFSQQRGQRHQFRTERLDLRGIRVRIGREQTHFEALHQFQRLLPGAAGADDAQRSARKPASHVLVALPPFAGAGQAILDQHLLRQREHIGDRHRRHGSSHRDRRVSDQYAGTRHCRDVDRVVADPVPGDQRQPTIRAGDRCGGYVRRVDVNRVVARRDIGRDFGHRFADVLPLQHIAGFLENIERTDAERRLTRGREQVACQADFEQTHGIFSAASTPRCPAPAPSDRSANPCRRRSSRSHARDTPCPSARQPP